MGKICARCGQNLGRIWAKFGQNVFREFWHVSKLLGKIFWHVGKILGKTLARCGQNPGQNIFWRWTILWAKLFSDLDNTVGRKSGESPENSRESHGAKCSTTKACSTSGNVCQSQFSSSKYIWINHIFHHDVHKQLVDMVEVFTESTACGLPLHLPMRG